MFSDDVEDMTCKNEEIHLSRLRSNPFLPVFTLPSELLEIIFIYGARDHYYDERGSHFTSHLPTWVNVSYVCRRWRDVALNCQTLWTYHFNLSLCWTEELLLRSRQALLKISCIDPLDPIFWWPGLLDNLRNHSERIQELFLRITPSHLPDDFFLQAPRLEILIIRSDFPLNGRLLITDAGIPVLRKIELMGCSVQWHLLNLSKLQSLSITLCDDFPRDQFDPVKLLTAMCSMQNLTVLHLESVTLSDVTYVMSGSGDHNVSQKIDLPCLAILDVSANLPEVDFLFSCIEVPLKTQIHLDLTLKEDTSAEDYAPLFSFLAQRFSTSEKSSSSGPIVRSLVMFIGDWISLTFSPLEWDCDPALRINYGVFKSAIPLQITFRMNIGDAQLHPITTDFCRSLSLSNVQTLCVEGEAAPWDFRYWRELFGCLDNLRYLKLERSCMPNLSMLSLATAPEPGEDSDGQDQDQTLSRTLVPALEKVELDKILFLYDDTTAHHDGMSKKSFLDTLSTRKGLRDVIMNNCEVGEWSESEP